MPGRGPEGNARLTALAGAVLLVLLAIEGVTLVALGSLISWHIFVGVLVVPVVGLKLASTGWKFMRYYTRRREYVDVGPPHVLLRLLGPLVVVSTLALLATGLVLVVVGPGSGAVIFLHQASFVVWFGALGVHVLAHLPRLPRVLRGDAARRDPVGGRTWRIALVAASIAVGVVAAAIVLPHDAAWLDWARVEH